MKKTLNAGISNEVRKAIYRRDGWECACCGSTRQLGVHHIVHRGRGGCNEPWNLVTLCNLCHMTLHGQRPKWAGVPMELNADAVEARVMEYICDHYMDLNALWTPEGLIDVDTPTDSDLLSLLEAQYLREWPSDVLRKYLDGGGR